ncbi:MAG: hypothetical protein CL521_04375 [Actinobacteria bacterium]|nr:hypothetical protein [Actinomycetota bacterium]
MSILDWIAVLFLFAGSFFFLGTAIGLLRFPDFYTRTHAAGKGDTLSSFLILAACMCYAISHSHDGLGTVLLVLKLLFIANFIGIGSPTATHAIMDAGYETGVTHWHKDKAK